MVHRFIILISVGLLSGCAAAPPVDDVLGDARQAIASAEEVDADELAPLELRFAREKMAEAQRFAAAGKSQEAAWRAEQAEVSAELAAAKARATATRNEVQAVRDQISALKRDIEALAPADS